MVYSFCYSAFVFIPYLLRFYSCKNKNEKEFKSLIKNADIFISKNFLMPSSVRGIILCRLCTKGDRRKYDGDMPMYNKYKRRKRRMYNRKYKRKLKKLSNIVFLYMKLMNIKWYIGIGILRANLQRKGFSIL